MKIVLKWLSNITGECIKIANLRISVQVRFQPKMNFVLITLLKILSIVVPLLIAVAYFTIAKKETKDSTRRRLLASNLKYLLDPITPVSVVSIILLIFYSPILSMIWLVVSSFCFLYVKHYKSISKIWFITLTIWYLIFTITLAEIQILIGFDHTPIVIIYLMDNDVLFPNLCYQTVCILDVLSSKLGFPIYIPGFLGIMKTIIDFFKKPSSPTGCAREENRGSSQKKSEEPSSSNRYWLWPSNEGDYWIYKKPPTRGETAINDMRNCASMAEILNARLKKDKTDDYLNTASVVKDGRKTIVWEAEIPFLGRFSNCTNRPAANGEGDNQED
jgi:hypothetical protein